MKPAPLENPVQHLLARLERDEPRWIVGLAGLPGSGKSTLARQLESELNARTAPGTLVALGMDGFHFSKAQLGQFPDPTAAFARRGAPWTFDTDAFLQRLQRLRSASNNALVQWPGFEHGVGDPVEDAFEIAPATRLILVEGLYLLHDADGWAPIARCFDERWFLDTSLEIALERLTQRHIKSWNLTRARALRRIAANDALNAQIVLRSRPNADFLVAG